MSGFQDSKTPYAFVSFYGDRSYGHMAVKIRNLVGVDNWRDPIIAITCQVGGEPTSSYDPCSKPYAIRVGLEFVDGIASHQAMEDGMKLSRKLDRALKKMEEDFGEPQTFAETCWRVILASGVDYAFTNLNWGGGYSKLEDLPTHRLHQPGSKGRLRVALEEMERTMCAHYAKKAA